MEHTVDSTACLRIVAFSRPTMITHRRRSHRLLMLGTSHRGSAERYQLQHASSSSKFVTYAVTLCNTTYSATRITSTLTISMHPEPQAYRTSCESPSASPIIYLPAHRELRSPHTPCLGTARFTATMVQHSTAQHSTCIPYRLGPRTSLCMTARTAFNSAFFLVGSSSRRIRDKHRSDVERPVDGYLLVCDGYLLDFDGCIACLLLSSRRWVGKWKCESGSTDGCCGDGDDLFCVFVCMWRSCCVVAYIELLQRRARSQWAARRLVLDLLREYIRMC
jgi:hypothetical protein